MFYAACGVFNLAFSAPAWDEGYAAYASMAWLPPVEWLVTDVLHTLGPAPLIGVGVF